MVPDVQVSQSVPKSLLRWGSVRRSDSPDEARTTELVHEYLPLVFRLLRHLGVDEADVDDAMQQVFLVVAQHLPQLEDGHERGFVSSTAVRIASRWRRTHRRRREVVELEHVEQRACERPSPERQVERVEAQQLLLAILETMPSKLREVFVLFEVEELTMREIAGALDLPTGTVASRLRLARQHFHLEVAAFEGAPEKLRLP
jgi:RNA polymerase sigma-70 factor, ECF subfamily